MGNDKTIIYAPEGQLHDSVQASGVLNISDLSRKEIKNLAKKAAGWSGENGTFSWQDVASGQADIQGKFTRHEDLFRRRFNKQLEKNLHHTEQQQLLQAAKNGNPEAMGQYVASKRDDTAPIIGAVTVGPAALMAGIGTGALTGVVQGGKWLFNNPITGTTLDALGTVAGHKNFFSDNGYKKTIARAKEGDVWGTVASGAGDVLDFLGPLDLLRRGKQVVNFIENPTHTYKFKYIDDIGDGGTRWQRVNDTNVDSEFQRLKDFRSIDQGAIAKMAAENGDDVWHIVPRLTEKSVVDAYTDISNSSQLGGKEWLNKIGWTSDTTADEWIKKMDDMLNPKSSNYNPKLKKELEFWGIDPRVRSNPSMQTKKMIVDYHKTAENAKDYVQKSYTRKHKKLSNDDLNSMFDDFPEQKMTLYGENVGNSNNINDHLYIGTTPSKFEFYTKVKPEKWSDLFTKKYWKDLDLSGTTLTSVAAHETAHGNRMFNTEANIDMFTPADKRIQILMESPQYALNYQAVPERWKQLLKPSKYVNSHDIELSEGYGDLWGTRANMYERGIGKKASFDPNKKYNYFDLLRYKMTPIGMTDRFIIQRGGWWKGWKQQLDALNEIYKKGGSIHIKKKNRGKFTESAKRAGMGVQEYVRHVLANKDKYSSTLVKRANFARNAKKFKHEDGGILKAQEGTGNLYAPHPLSPVGIALNQAKAMVKIKGEQQHLPPGVKEVVGPDGKKIAIRIEQPLIPLEQNIAEWLPGTGDVAEVGYIANDVKNGNLGSAALAAGLMVLPGNTRKILDKFGVDLGDISTFKRLSDQEWDDMYFQAIDSGDMDLVQTIRDAHFKVKAPNTKAIDSDGNPIRLFHGEKDSPSYHDLRYLNSGPDHNGLGVYYSSNSKDIAKTYAQHKGGPTGQVREVYYNIENPNVVNAEGRSFQTVLIEEGAYGSKTGVSTDKLVNRTYWEKTPEGYRKKSDKDGLIIQNVEDHAPGWTGSNEDAIANNYVTWNPYAVKSAEAIVKHPNTGEIIPISKRDNFNVPSILMGTTPLILGLGATKAVSNNGNIKEQQ